MRRRAKLVFLNSTQLDQRRRLLKGSVFLRRKKKKGLLHILNEFLLHRRRWRIDRSLGGQWSGTRPSTAAVIISERRQRAERGPNGSGRRCVPAAIQARAPYIDSRRLRATRWGPGTVVGLGSLLPFLFRIFVRFFYWVGALLAYTRAVERSLR